MTAYEPGVVLAFTVIERITVAGEGGRLTFVGLRVAANPAEALADRLTLPTWPGNVETSIVDQPEYPWTIDIEVGKALRRNSIGEELSPAEGVVIPGERS